MKRKKTQKKDKSGATKGVLPLVFWINIVTSKSHRSSLVDDKSNVEQSGNEIRRRTKRVRP